MDKKEFRKKVLQIHYDLSKGSTINLVMRPEVGAILGMDFNGEELISAIMYLQDKGFLEGHTNVEDAITTYGIDEVENGFPTLGPVEDFQIKNDPLLELLHELDEKIDFGKKGLLSNNEFAEIRRKVVETLDKNLIEGTVLWREFDKQKHVPVWTSLYNHGYVSSKEAGILDVYKVFIVRAIEEKGQTVGKTQKLIQKGEFYSARQVIRQILQNAKLSVDIQDNFIDTEILAILEPYIKQTPSLKIRLLTQKIDNPFKSDFSLFVKQYGNSEAKVHQDCHDRFIVIDGTEVYHSGHSLKDLGKKASMIALVEDKEEKEKFVRAFEDWWKNGVTI